MNKATVLKAQTETERFLRKVAKQNEPFQAFTRTDVYKSFYKAIKEAAKTQGSTIAEALRNLDTSSSLAMNDDLQPLSDNELAHVAQLVKQQMPSMSDLISHEMVFNAIKAAFIYSVKAQYKRWGLIVKADVNFDLTNEMYIQMLNDQANYLLNQSSIDDTTRSQLINLIKNGKLDGLTIDEIASEIDDQFDVISENRAFVIARTETAQAMGSANLATMQENGVQTKHWVAAGSHVCEICQGNVDDGSIGVNDSFSSGDDSEPAHPNCECYTEADEIDLDSIDIWGGE